MALSLPAASPTAPLWLAHVQVRVETALGELFRLPDEARLDARWTRAVAQARAYALRPAKRLRPALVALGHAVARGTSAVPEALWPFAAGLELVHTFLLIHDDVADGAALRRSGPSLHRVLGEGKLGEDLAVVAGDHLFARGVEAMLECPLGPSTGAVRYYLAICRQTAAGQYLDIALSQSPLADVTLQQALRVARLKTARYGFVAPLVCGALLAGAPGGLRQKLERVGRHMGLAYQLRDDVLGLFGDSHACGKSSEADFVEGKRTFPVLASYLRAPPSVRAELEALWNAPRRDSLALARARSLVASYGGLAATERLIDRATRAARAALLDLPRGGGVVDVLDELLVLLARRVT